MYAMSTFIELSRRVEKKAFGLNDDWNKARQSPPVLQKLLILLPFIFFFFSPNTAAATRLPDNCWKYQQTLREIKSLLIFTIKS